MHGNNCNTKQLSQKGNDLEIIMKESENGYWVFGKNLKRLGLSDWKNIYKVQEK